MLQKLFIIPWFFAYSVYCQSEQNNQFDSNGGYIDKNLYQFLRRQHEINNALLLNPIFPNPTIRRDALQINGLNFSPPPLIHPPLPSSPHSSFFLPPTGLHPSIQNNNDKLGLFDVLTYGHINRNEGSKEYKYGNEETTTKQQKDDNVKAEIAGVAQYVPDKDSIDITPSTTLSPSTPLSTVQIIYSTAFTKRQKIEEEKQIAQLEEELKEDIVSSDSTSTESIVEKPTKLVKNVKDEADRVDMIDMIDLNTTTTTTTEKSTTTTTEKKPNVIELLRSLNLTHNETQQLFEHVQHVVKMELAKKLIDSELASIQEEELKKALDNATEISSSTQSTSTTTSSSTTSSTTIIPTTTTTIQTISIPKPIAFRVSSRLHTQKKNILDKDVLLDLSTEESKEVHSRRKQRNKDINGGAIQTSERRLQLEDNYQVDDDIEGRPLDERDGLYPSLSEGLTHLPINPVTPSTQKSPDAKVLAAIESDADLLLFGPTAAPLDLSIDTEENIAYRSRSLKSSLPPTSAMTQSPVIPRKRLQTHKKTVFESLARDYRNRLSGNDDIQKIIKGIYENAYIALVGTEKADRRNRFV